MAIRIQLRRDLAINWTNEDPTLADGEIGYEKDTGKAKIGNGVDNWVNLAYVFEGLSDHGQLSGLSDDDHLQYLTELRHDQLPSDNPHGVTKGQIGLGSVDNTSDEDKPVSIAQQAAIDLKYDASNPNGYETPAELSLRDSANRDRSNHTGQQGSSTISDFTTAVKNAETVTSLSFNSSTNILSYTKEDGTTDTEDLSLFLDNTDLTVVSGTLDANTGIATFTRNDNSTFTLDLSGLSSIQNASETPLSPSGNLVSSNVQDGMVELQLEIDSIQSDQSTQDSNISSNTSGISSLNSSQSTQDVLISNNSSSISTIQNEQTTQNSNISGNASDISTLNTSQANQDTVISSNSSAISSLQSGQLTQDTAIGLNTQKVSADGSIGTHSDVDVTSITPSINDIFRYDGANWVPASIDNGFTIFPIWAEESGALSNNNRQYSFGNGATGAINIPLAFDCEVFAMSMHAENSGTSVSIDLMRDDGAVTTQNFNGASGVATFTAIPYLQGQLVGFRTAIEVGNYSDVRVCAWFRVASTALFPTSDRKVVNNSNVAFTSGTFATIPNLITSVTITDEGTVDGTLVYSAARSGTVNSEAIFRVVINGTNGLNFNDTLSTFNDVGAASFFVENLPAGTYSVSAECSVSQPILIASCQLTVVGVEG